MLIESRFQAATGYGLVSQARDSSACSPPASHELTRLNDCGQPVCFLIHG